MLTFETIYKQNPSRIKSFIKNLFQEEINETGEQIKILDFENGNLICKLGNATIVIDMCNIITNGSVEYDKTINIVKFLTKIYGEDFVDAMISRREIILDDIIEKYTINTQRIFLELHKLSKNPIEKDVTWIGVLHQKHPKLVEDFIKKLYAKEIKEAGQDIEFVYDGCALECKLGGEWVIVDDSAYYETDCSSKRFQVAKFLAKMCGQKYIDTAMAMNLDVFQTEVKEHNELTQQLILNVNEVLKNNRQKETELKI